MDMSRHVRAHPLENDKPISILYTIHLLMSQISRDNLLNARVQYGHLSRMWHPKYAPFIFMKQKGSHVIDVDQTITHLTKATAVLRELIESGKKILFVGTKKQAKEIIEGVAQRLEQPYMTEKWLGGTLTNFSTIKRLMKKLQSMDSQKESVTYQHLTKREKLTIERNQAKLQKILKGMSTINRLPAALFVVDVNKERKAINEARLLEIPVFAIIDSNASPEWVDYPIPGNDDACASIRIIMEYIQKELLEGLKTWKTLKAEREHEEVMPHTH